MFYYVCEFVCLYMCMCLCVHINLHLFFSLSVLTCSETWPCFPTIRTRTNLLNQSWDLHWSAYKLAGYRPCALLVAFLSAVLSSPRPNSLRAASSSSSSLPLSLNSHGHSRPHSLTLKKSVSTGWPKSYSHAPHASHVSPSPSQPIWWQVRPTTLLCSMSPPYGDGRKCK